MTTPKGIPEISVNQAQKEVTHNEAINMIDGLLLLVIQDRDLTGPPGSPINGTCYIPASVATGAWATHEDEIAHYYNDSWHFYSPWYGWQVFIADEGTKCYWNNTNWVYFDEIVSGIKIDAADSWFSEEVVADPAALTSADLSGGASLSDVITEFNKLRADVGEIRTQLSSLLSALRLSTGCGVLDDNP